MLSCALSQVRMCGDPDWSPITNENSKMPARKRPRVCESSSESETEFWGFEDEEGSDIEVDESGSDSDESESEGESDERGAVPQFGVGKWSEAGAHDTTWPHTKPFAGPPEGPTYPMAEDTTEIDFFEVFMQPWILNLIVKVMIVNI